jgi:ferredoxin
MVRKCIECHPLCLENFHVDEYRFERQNQNLEDEIIDRSSLGADEGEIQA